MDLSTIVTSISAASVVTGTIIAILQLRNFVKNRQAQLFMELYNKFLDPDFRKKEDSIFLAQWKDYDDWYIKYGPVVNPEMFYTLNSIMTFFEGIGVLAEKKLIEIDLIDNLMGPSIRDTWEKMGPLVKELRKRTGYRVAYEWTEYLYKTIVEYESKRGLTKEK